MSIEIVMTAAKALRLRRRSHHLVMGKTINVSSSAHTIGSSNTSAICIAAIDRARPMATKGNLTYPGNSFTILLIYRYIKHIVTVKTRRSQLFQNYANSVAMR